jgi:bifunctional non-homologous end joining protein LigD
VAAPGEWDELAKLDSSGAFTILDADRLLGRARSLAGWGQADQSLPLLG